MNALVTPNVEVQGRCAALSRGAPWNAVLGLVFSFEEAVEDKHKQDAD